MNKMSREQGLGCKNKKKRKRDRRKAPMKIGRR
jgi:hypothetical protein